METSPSGHAMLRQRCINVDATSRRCIDVDATLYKRDVSAGRHCFCGFKTQRNLSLVKYGVSVKFFDYNACFKNEFIICHILQYMETNSAGDTFSHNECLHNSMTAHWPHSSKLFATEIMMFAFHENYLTGPTCRKDKKYIYFKISAELYSMC